jgi:hypothetical protein
MQRGYSVPYGSEPISSMAFRVLSTASRSFTRSFSAEAAATSTGAKHDALHLRFAVPSRVLVNNKVVSRVTLPGRGGTFGVERNMPPTVAELRPGVVLVEYEKGEKEEFFVPVWSSYCSGVVAGFQHTAS